MIASHPDHLGISKYKMNVLGIYFKFLTVIEKENETLFRNLRLWRQ